MGESFYIVNLDKRQYLNPSSFGDFEGDSGYLKGRHATALAALVSAAPPNRWPSDSDLAGNWHGDRIQGVFSDIFPDSHGFQTATTSEPHRTLYQMVWEEFDDLSPLCIIMLCNRDDDTAEAMARMAAASDPHLIDLGRSLEQGQSSRLEYWLQKLVGENWKAAYKAASEEFDNVE